MKLKTAILLCLILSASIATLVIGLNTSRLNLQELYEKSILDIDPLPPPPGPTSGDPIGGGGGPH